METTQYESFYKVYRKKLYDQYPSVAQFTHKRNVFECSGVSKHSPSVENQPSSPVLEKAGIKLLPISPFLIHLSQNIVNQISDLVQILYKISHLKSYTQNIQTDKGFYLKAPILDSSVLMSYDFHIDQAEQLKLIEVNTHSSGYLVSNLVDQVQGVDYSAPVVNPITLTEEYRQENRLQQANAQTAILSLRKSFENDWKLFSNQESPPSEVLIVDRHITDQKMYIEFLMYKDLLNSWGWPCRLQEIESLNINSKGELVDSHQKPVEMIYNRCTDFYFENLPYLRQAFLNQVCCISPHPGEYLLLADKARLCEWSSEEFLNQLNISSEEKARIQNAVPFTAHINSVSKEELWNKRKKLFFKPLRGYGGKSVYRGKNISRKVFDRVTKEPGVFQEIAPPPVFIDPAGEEWKYDIRAYVYRDQVQKLSARVYKGQLTQFQEPFSGFATVVVS